MRRPKRTTISMGEHVIGVVEVLPGESPLVVNVVAKVSDNPVIRKLQSVGKHPIEIVVNNLKEQ